MAALHGSLYSYKLITVTIPSLTQLTHITTKTGTHKICFTELFIKLASPYCSIDTVRRQA